MPDTDSLPIIRNPLLWVWAFLTAITVTSWWISRNDGSGFQVNAAITVGVLLIAAIKTQLVMRYFMEVRVGPAWLKRATLGWVVLLFSLLLLAYYLLL